MENVSTVLKFDDTYNQVNRDIVTSYEQYNYLYLYVTQNGLYFSILIDVMLSKALTTNHAKLIGLIKY